MMKKKTFVVLVFLLCLLCLSGCSSPSAKPVLTEEQVTSLRDKYPIYPVASTGNVTIDTSVPVEEMAAHMETAHLWQGAF